MECLLTASGLQVSAWLSLGAPAKADVWLRAVGINGDGLTDPQIGNIILEVR